MRFDLLSLRYVLHVQQGLEFNPRNILNPEAARHTAGAGLGDQESFYDLHQFGRRLVFETGSDREELHIRDGNDCS
jgi:hypothetical protein